MQKLGIAAAVALSLAACTNAESAPAGTAADEVSASWLATHLPPGSQAEGEVLTLVNDPSISMAGYVARCGFSESQAAAIVNYRSGDEPGTSADDQRFDTLAELDALPFTDASFWTSAKACAAGIPVCLAAPVVVELVIDQSGSMHGEKWIAAQEATKAMIDELSAKTPNVYLGALLYSSSVGKKVKPRQLSDVDHLEALRYLIDDATPTGATGTLDAMRLGYETVLATATAPNAKRIVVLLSDGVPNGGETEQAQIVDLVRETAAEGVVTHAIGIGAFPSSNSGYRPEYMGQIAQAGGTAPAGCDPLSSNIADVCHHQVTPGGGVAATKQSILDAFRVIAPPAPACP